MFRSGPNVGRCNQYNDLHRVDSNCADKVSSVDIMSRPEHIAPPEIYYGQDEAKKYAGKYVTR